MCACPPAKPLQHTYLFSNSKPTKVAAHEKWNKVSRRRRHHRYDIVEKIIYDEAVCERAR